MQGNARGLGVLFLILSSSALLIVNLYPTGDWVTAPLTTFVLGLPLLLVQLILLVLFFRTQQWSRINLAAQGVLTLCYILWMLYYVVTH